MLDMNMYKTALLSKGENLSQIRNNQSVDIMNATFKGDPNYKKIYVQVLDEELDQEQEKGVEIITDEIYGFHWKLSDAKYSKHTSVSMLKDSVDYYLQLRPREHITYGRYIVIPDDTTYEPDVNNISFWWFVVECNNNSTFIRYLILKCNWIFKWIDKGEIKSWYGCVRDSSNYNSGVWTDEYSTSIDGQYSAIMPDSVMLESIWYDTRLMISSKNRGKTRALVYSVTKLIDERPEGVLKLTLKQDLFDKNRDNIQLGVCNYYDGNGLITVTSDVKNVETPDPSEIYNYSEIYVTDVTADDSNKIYMGKGITIQAPIVKVNWSYEMWHYADDTHAEDYHDSLKDKLFKEIVAEDTKLSLRISNQSSLVGNYYVKIIGYNDELQYFSVLQLEVLK